MVPQHIPDGKDQADGTGASLDDLPAAGGRDPHGAVGSGSHLTPDRKPDISTPPAAGTDNRGKRPKEGIGEVEGSGAGAGGGGNPEDFDSDTAGGGAAQ
ncbi:MULTISPECIES: hypothetical protein [Sphingobium]|jgi:hypothetical protein|uniref:Uncharacterized protein n=2 Tax=Sphingobium fuliginis (strain ATCC 27551) TaxID=336203 RepID=A0ABQ1F105_SPHSA|nr:MULTISPECIES: hypothetical protein [Sphingobium]PNQ00692.1 hypothetical protein A8G00_17140 [Sphingobium sp. SA916]QDC39358.1 hypothetical protein FIL70_19140 [Sphingobium fuliginis ATCC 27551]RYL97289.1 hypothetical protein EWH10_15695 [Sphingobium fuliginis]UXC93043.1 hypothetical protein EGM87_22360 [Sphingobium sp. RSMS]WDA35705.1 hypothetical protein PO876_19960 [Sphingobium sp. YC-XJ3]